MNKPIYDKSLAVIGYLLETSAVTFVQKRNGDTAFFYNKLSDKPFNAKGEPLPDGNEALEFLKNQTV